MIVLGMGFGDEGKGLTTSFLCDQTDKPLVVRFNGGHQAGHTVVRNGIRHVFSSFGSGTLQGAPTYWSSFCTVYPIGFINELRILTESKHVQPFIMIDPYSPITTPYDIDRNRSKEQDLKHGSVGVGFGATIQRTQDHYGLFFKDLFYPSILMAKLEKIRLYYSSKPHKDIDAFIDACKQMVDFVKTPTTLHEIKARIANGDYKPIFEGSQGIMLDMDNGIFPNVTRSNTTSKNIQTLDLFSKDVYYVTRCYQTRHGNGFMTNELSASTLGLKNHEKETNVSNPWQGNFRIGVLDTELLNYALESDAQFSVGRYKHLVITCCDQLPGIDPKEIADSLSTNFSSVHASYGPEATDIRKIR